MVEQLKNQQPNEVSPLLKFARIYEEPYQLNSESSLDSTDSYSLEVDQIFRGCSISFANELLGSYGYELLEVSEFDGYLPRKGVHGHVFAAE